MLEIRDPNGKVVSVRDYNQEMMEQYNRQGTGFYARRRINRTVVALSCCCVLLGAVLIGVLLEREVGVQAETELKPTTQNPNAVDLRAHYADAPLPNTAVRRSASK
ncbi:MAG: hypothetical protein AB8B55_00280 [Mariniblastus sp.]